MPKRGPLHKVDRLRDNSGEFGHITIGEVVDTNDPQQMGRIRVACPLLGDLEDSIIEDIPWASYVSPFGGTTTTPSRGRTVDKQTAGPIAYGLFNIPKVGSSAIVACIDGDPRFRVWMGCFHDQFLTHTMPHGRYSYKTANKPDGPFSSSEDKIQPLYDSQTQAFTRAGGPEPRQSFEFRTRAADVSVSGLGDEYVDVEDSAISLLSDDVDAPYTESDGTSHTNTQGYAKSRVEAGMVAKNTGGDLYDPQVYSWTTPGFHAVSMSDSAENCRIRVRTTHGHQIIMDDTNERVYISTAGGKTWIEMDEVGNIDIYGERNISVHAKKDINLTAGGNFRVQAEEGIHMQTNGDMHVSGNNVHVKSEDTLNLESFGVLNIKTDDAMKLDSLLEMNILSGANVLVTGSEVHLNGPPASAASEATAADPATSRKPDHEPWPRTMLDPTTGEPELPYDSPDVGRKEGDEELPRNPNWHR